MFLYDGMAGLSGMYMPFNLSTGVKRSVGIEVCAFKYCRIVKSVKEISYIFVNQKNKRNYDYQ